jgi:hypothetical protein
MSGTGHLDMLTSAQIEALRGRVFVPGFKYKTLPKRPLRELTQREKEAVVERRAKVHALGQDAVDFVSELHKAGLIDGWRSVGDVVIFNEGEHHENA